MDRLSELGLARGFAEQDYLRAERALEAARLELEAATRRYDEEKNDHHRP